MDAEVRREAEVRKDFHENEITSAIISSAFEIHSHLGPGLLESAYRTCLKYELEKQGFIVESEVELPLAYKEIVLSKGYRLDLLVDRKVVVELKVVDKLIEVHEAQLLTYLKLTNHKVGLLLNFNVTRMKDGIIRKVNKL